MNTHIIELNNKERDVMLDDLFQLRGELNAHTCVFTLEGWCVNCDSLEEKISRAEKKLEAFEDSHYTSHEE